MLNKKNLIGSFFIFAFCFLTAANTFAADNNTVCVTYISGIGCGNCAVTDPILLTKMVRENPNVYIIKYEIYKDKEYNKETKDAYFRSFLPWRKPGIPFLILNKDQVAVGKFNVLKAAEAIKYVPYNQCPSREGLATDLNILDITRLPGKFTIWTKNRVLLSGSGGNSKVLREVLTEEDIDEALNGVNYKKVKPVSVPISRGEINFENAVMIGSWRLQWNGEPVEAVQHLVPVKVICRTLIALLFIVLVGFLTRIIKTDKGWRINFAVGRKRRDAAAVCLAAMFLIYLFLIAQGVSPNFLEKSGYSMPLPVFTFLIAIVDGFNPCNMFVLTCLLVLLISTSDSRLRLYAVALSFVAVVFVIYFLFMAAWLNAFKYFGMIGPLRIGIAIIAIIAGLINCKELLFFRKGVSLMIQEKHKGSLMRKIDMMKDIVVNGSFPLLIASSVGLASLASLVELPCTAGFPIIYTAVLVGRGMENTLLYYAYLLLYNLVYIIPLLAIISIFIYTFKGRQITQRQVQIMKFIGGMIMIVLGIILLVNPGLIGLSLG